jgi:hypothetical protein
MMIPANAFPGALWTDIAGVVVGIGLIVSELGMLRRLRRYYSRATP